MRELVLTIVYTLLIVEIGLNLFLSILNVRYRDKSLPNEVSDIYDREKYIVWKNYYMDNYRLSLIKSLIGFLTIIILLLSNYFVFIGGFADSITIKPSFQALIVIGSYFLISYVIDLIFSYISIFKIEEKYGFNKMSKKLFVIDKIKSLILTIILGGGAIYALISLYQEAGDLFFIIAWTSVTVVMIVVNISYTKIIVPIFNKLKPLEESSLKTKIIEFAKSVGYEISKISVIDASKRTTKLNAYFSGFGKAKRIVLYDTLMNKMNEEEIVAVLAHEIGHNKHKHIIFNLLQSIIMISIYVLGLMLFLSQDNFSIYFGFDKLNYGFNAILYLLLLSPLMFMLNPLFNYISRKFEYQADSYAAKNYSKEHLINALKVLSRENFSNLTPHPIYVKFYYSHPPLYQRISNIKKVKSK